MRCLLALLLAAGAAHAAGADLERVEDLIVQRTNDFRAEQGRARLGADAALARAARAFADYMARTDRYGHTADGSEPADRARARGYDYCLVSENISYQFSTEPYATADLARRYVEGWKDSPGHRRNLLDPGVVDMAVAVARSARTGRHYAVQMFGRPRAQSVEFRVVNAARAAVRYRTAGEDHALAPGQARIHTQCVAQEVTFAAASEEGRRFRPSNGDHLVVEGDRRVRVRVRR